MSGKAPPPSRGRGRGRGCRGGAAPYPSPSAGHASLPPPPTPADTTISTLCLEDIPSSVTKKDIIIALGHSADSVAHINLRPLRQQALIEFKNRRGAEAAQRQNLGWLKISGKKYVLSWVTPESQIAILIPPPPPNAFPELDSFGRTQARGLGRGTYDPQFRQVGHFMDSSQLVVGPGEKVTGKVKRV